MLEIFKNKTLLENVMDTNSSLQEDLLYFQSNYYLLLEQKMRLIKFLEEHNATYTLNKIKEIEHDTNNDNR